MSPKDAFISCGEMPQPLSLTLRSDGVSRSLNSISTFTLVASASRALAINWRSASGARYISLPSCLLSRSGCIANESFLVIGLVLGWWNYSQHDSSPSHESAPLPHAGEEPGGGLLRPSWPAALRVVHGAREV